MGITPMGMNPAWVVRTARLVLRPVGGADLADLQALKGDARVFAVMLGGVRSIVQTTWELADEVAGWGADGFGIWSARESDGGAFAGIAGLMRRPDGRGISLRFALWPEAQGRGLAREAAGAALRFGHDQVGLRRIVAVSRMSNFGSREVLGGIGMRECDRFERDGHMLLVFESVLQRPPW